MRLLLDTNICIEILRGRDSALLARYAALPRADVALSSVVRSELLAGAMLSANAVENRRAAEDFCALFPCLPFDAKAADIHAEWHVRLRRSGTLIGAHDLMIAATALVYDLIVVTRNTNEFKRIETLHIDDWLV